MPIYEYRCDNCGHELEAFQKLSENPLQTCPECGEDKLIKKVSAAGFRLKGSGWYETDFKSKGDKKRNVGASDSSSASSSSSGESSSSSSSDRGKSETKTKPTGSSGGDASSA